MVDQSDGAVDRWAFFIAGDDQADPALMRRRDCSDERGNARLHIDRAPTIEQAAAYFRRERVA